MKIRLFSLLRSTLFLTIIGTSQGSAASPIIDYLWQFAFELPCSVLVDIHRELKKMERKGLSMERDYIPALTSDELQEAFIAQSHHLNPSMKPCYYFGRVPCNDGKDCKFLHNPSRNFEKERAKRKRYKKAAIDLKEALRQRYSLGSSAQTSSTEESTTTASSTQAPAPQAPSPQAAGHSNAPPAWRFLPLARPTGEIDSVMFFYYPKLSVYLAGHCGITWAYSEYTGLFIWWHEGM
jgi:hypothetical protein